MKKEQLRTLASDKRDGVRRNAQRLLKDGSDSQKASALQAIADLDALELEEREELAERVSGMDRAEKVTEAFRVHPPTEAEAKLIEVILRHPGATLDKLNEELGYVKGWDLHFGSMCGARAEYLWPGPFVESRNAQHLCGILCDTGREDGRMTFTLKSDVAAAFEAMGFRALK